MKKKNILFCSSLRGMTGTSTCMASVAYTDALVHSRKNLLLQTKSGHGAISDMLFEKKDRKFLQNSGIEELQIGMDAGRKCREFLPKCCQVVHQGRLEILTEKLSEREPMRMSKTECYKAIFREESDEYDFVFAESDFETENRTLIELADCVVLTLCQNEQVILRTLSQIQSGKKYVFLFGRYDDQSMINVKNVRSLFSLRKEQEVLGFPYHVDLMDACSCGKLPVFISRNLNAEPNDSYGVLMKSIKNVSSKIADMAWEVN